MPGKNKTPSKPFSNTPLKEEKFTPFKKTPAKLKKTPVQVKNTPQPNQESQQKKTPFKQTPKVQNSPKPNQESQKKTPFKQTPKVQDSVKLNQESQKNTPFKKTPKAKSSADKHVPVPKKTEDQIVQSPQSPGNGEERIKNKRNRGKRNKNNRNDENQSIQQNVKGSEPTFPPGKDMSLVYDLMVLLKPQAGKQVSVDLKAPLLTLLNSVTGILRHNPSGQLKFEYQDLSKAKTDLAKIDSLKSKEVDVHSHISTYGVDPKKRTLYAENYNENDKTIIERIKKIFTAQNIWEIARCKRLFGLEFSSPALAKAADKITYTKGNYSTQLERYKIPIRNSQIEDGPASKKVKSNDGSVVEKKNIKEKELKNGLKKNSEKQAKNTKRKVEEMKEDSDDTDEVEDEEDGEEESDQEDRPIDEDDDDEDDDDEGKQEDDEDDDEDDDDDDDEGADNEAMEGVDSDDEDDESD